MRFTVIFLSDFLSDFLTFSATFFVCVTPANMSDYTQLIHNIVLSVQNTPFLFDLIDDPIRVNSEDIFDVTSFIEDLVQTFDKLSLCVDPLEIIQIDEPISGEPVPDSWEDESDDELTIIDNECFGNITIGDGTHRTPYTDLPVFQHRILYDPEQGSGRLLPVSTKTWDDVDRPKTPVKFEDPDDIHYPPSPTTPPPPPYKESFDNFITNGQVFKENGKFMGKLPIPLQFIISIKVKEAIRIYKRSLSRDGFQTFTKKKASSPKKHIICKFGSACKHHASPSGCVFAHSLDEWCPIVCRHGENCWKFGKNSGNKNTCYHFHPEGETKVQYYKRQQKIPGTWQHMNKCCKKHN